MAYERLKGEGSRPFEAFVVYVELPPSERSIDAVALKIGKSNTLVSEWSRKYAWVARTRVHEDQVNAARQAAQLEQTKKTAAEWARRREESRQGCFDLGMEIRKRVLEMLSFPLSETTEEIETTETDPDTQAVTKVVITKVTRPARWVYSDLFRGADLSERLLRLSFGQPVTNVAIAEGKGNLDGPDKNLNGALAQLIRFRAGVDKEVDAALQADPRLDRHEVTRQYLEALPYWCAEDWGVPVEELLDADVKSQSAGIDVVAEAVS